MFHAWTIFLRDSSHLVPLTGRLFSIYESDATLLSGNITVKFPKKFSYYYDSIYTAV